nr:hypothetical protein [uncultured Bifidobacterium sp.]
MSNSVPLPVAVSISTMSDDRGVLLVILFQVSGVSWMYEPSVSPPLGVYLDQPMWDCSASVMFLVSCQVVSEMVFVSVMVMWKFDMALIW